MSLKRMDNVLIVVDDLEAVKAFFLELGLTLEGEQAVEGPLVGSLIGLRRCALPMGRALSWEVSHARRDPIWTRGRAGKHAWHSSHNVRC